MLLIDGRTTHELEAALRDPALPLDKLDRLVGAVAAAVSEAGDDACTKCMLVDLIAIAAQRSDRAVACLADSLGDRDSYKQTDFSDHEEVTDHAERGLYQVGTRRIPFVIAKLSSERSWTRARAARVLAWGPAAAADAIAALAPLLVDPEKDVRCAAAFALADLRKGEPSLVADVETLLATPESRLVGLWLAHGLAMEQHAAFVDRYTALLADPNPWVREAAEHRLKDARRGW